jgi:hypothetical protein
VRLRRRRGQDRVNVHDLVELGNLAKNVQVVLGRPGLALFLLEREGAAHDEAALLERAPQRFQIDARMEVVEVVVDEADALPWSRLRGDRRRGERDAGQEFPATDHAVLSIW